MIKECPVILHNEAVTVVKYDNTNVQFPSIKEDVKTVFVEHEGDTYKILDKIPEEPVVKKRGSRKKKTVECESENE